MSLVSNAVLTFVLLCFHWTPILEDAEETLSSSYCENCVCRLNVPSFLFFINLWNLRHWGTKSPGSELEETETSHLAQSWIVFNQQSSLLQWQCLLANIQKQILLEYVATPLKIDDWLCLYPLNVLFIVVRLTTLVEAHWIECGASPGALEHPGSAVNLQGNVFFLDAR